MQLKPLLATVIESTRLSPSFQRIRFSGLDELGPSGHIYDQRLKIILPGDNGLPQLPERDWLPVWRGLDAAKRGAMRTYSMRDLDRDAGILTVDFVLHGGEDGAPAGPAASWAARAQPGDTVLVVGPPRGDDSLTAIEFQPGEASYVHLLGDETALPAIARILEEWPAGLRGTVHVEVPTAADQLELASPPQVSVTFLPRDSEAGGSSRPYGQALIKAVARLTGLGSSACALPALDDAAPAGQPTAPSERIYLWETPTFSGEGEDLGIRVPGEVYWWIAGESGAVRQMRRMLVREAGISRAQVSFMGYWKRGVAEG